MHYPLQVSPENNAQVMEGALKRITMADVAERAGVQKSSVSVVLNGSKSNTHISASTRERILLAAQELGYKRNGGMASIASGRFGCVALLLSTKERVSTLPNRLWEGIYDSLAAESVHLSLFRLPDRDLTDQVMVPKILREWMADGMLVDYTHEIPDELKSLIESNSLPAVWINSKQEYDCVRPDDFNAGFSATKHLLELGHRRITYINLACLNQKDKEHYSVHDRYDGYVQAMQAVGASPDSLFGEMVPAREHVARIIELLKDPVKRPTAIIPYGAETNAVLWAANHLGLKVPHDLSIINMDPQAGEWTGTPLTSYLVPEYEMGQSAGSMILEKIANSQHKLKSKVIPFLFEEGNSVAPPPS